MSKKSTTNKNVICLEQLNMFMGTRLLNKTILMVTIKKILTVVSILHKKNITIII